MNLLELMYQRRTAKRQAAKLLDRAVDEGRNLTIAEQVQFDSFAAKIHQLDAAIIARDSLRKLVD